VYELFSTATTATLQQNWWNGLEQNLLKCRWILGFMLFQMSVIGVCFCCSNCNTAVHFGVKNTRFGVKISQISYKNALFGLFFSLFFFAKNEMFFVIFHLKLTKNEQNISLQTAIVGFYMRFETFVVKRIYQ